MGRVLGVPETPRCHCWICCFWKQNVSNWDRSACSSASCSLLIGYRQQCLGLYAWVPLTAVISHSAVLGGAAHPAPLAWPEKPGCWGLVGHIGCLLPGEGSESMYTHTLGDVADNLLHQWRWDYSEFVV